MDSPQISVQSTQPYKRQDLLLHYAPSLVLIHIDPNKENIHIAPSLYSMALNLAIRRRQKKKQEKY